MAELIDYSRFSEYHTPKRKSKWPFFLILLIVSIFLVLFAKNQLAVKKSLGEVISPLSKNVVDSGIELLYTHDNSKKLESIVQKELSGTKGNYAVVIKNLKTGERYYYNEHKTFETASLYKLFVMGTVFQNIQNGTMKHSDILSEEITVLNEKFKIASVSAELTEGKITLPVETALQRMITISDNYSALLLAAKVHLSKVALFLEQNSLNESTVGTSGEEPTTTANNMELFFKKLYEEDLANKIYTYEMLTLLKNQKLNGKIPKYLPKNITISHKTGELGRLSHDAGIVYTPSGDYVLIVLTETNSQVVANEKISNISKGVYDYFTK